MCENTFTNIYEIDCHRQKLCLMQLKSHGEKSFEPLNTVNTLLGYMARTEGLFRQPVGHQVLSDTKYRVSGQTAMEGLVLVSCVSSGEFA